MGNWRNWKPEVEFRNSRWRRPRTSSHVLWRHFRSRIMTSLRSEGLELVMRAALRTSLRQFSKGGGGRAYGACNRGDGAPPLSSCAALPFLSIQSSSVFYKLVMFVIFLLKWILAHFVFERGLLALSFCQSGLFAHRFTLWDFTFNLGFEIEFFFLLISSVKWGFC